MEDSISIGFVDNLILFRAMKKLWKSVKVWQSYGREYVAYFFLAHPVDEQSLEWSSKHSAEWVLQTSVIVSARNDSMTIKHTCSAPLPISYLHKHAHKP